MIEFIQAMGEADILISSEFLITFQLYFPAKKNLWQRLKANNVLFYIIHRKTTFPTFFADTCEHMIILANVK